MTVLTVCYLFVLLLQNESANYINRISSTSSVGPGVKTMNAIQYTKLKSISRMSRIEVDSSRKISEMSKRIRQLEDALSVSHASGSDEKHPLLNNKLLAIKFDPRVQQPTGDPDSGQDESEESIPHLTDALGILSIGEEEVRYYGASAGSEPFLSARGGIVTIDLAKIHYDLNR